MSFNKIKNLTRPEWLVPISDKFIVLTNKHRRFDKSFIDEGSVTLNDFKVGRIKIFHGAKYILFITRVDNVYDIKVLKSRDISVPQIYTDSAIYYFEHDLIPDTY